MYNVYKPMSYIMKHIKLCHIGSIAIVAASFAQQALTSVRVTSLRST